MAEWVNDALGRLKNFLCKQAQNEWNRLKKTAKEQSEANPDGKKRMGRPPKNMVASERLERTQATVGGLEHTKYLLGKNPESLTGNQQVKPDLIQNSYPKFYKAYQMTGEIRLLLHLCDVDLCAHETDGWAEKAKFGFRNIQHMIDMIMLICSDLVIQLPNRPARKTA